MNVAWAQVAGSGIRQEFRYFSLNTGTLANRHAQIEYVFVFVFVLVLVLVLDPIGISRTSTIHGN